ncbi:sperm flagellar protein 2 isoform X4 [Mauremys reevesii]|uniref:sperm flagellar protein 2 isoform X4 n=1 Tax=Mauremys reevesii TaxID=260615 RepID=UPI00193FD2D0|nr:sperm flagellar protein 2 isoform X4 [Mauremys reevesii]
MSDILCEWLNREVKLSRTVDPKSFPKEFSTGYLIGEILHKYELQDDFNQFSQSRVANSKLNNFSRLEPTFQLLGVQFDQNEAQNIMTEQHGAATKLLYQLYVALEKKKKAGLTGVAMEAMRPAAPAKLQGIESKLYREHRKGRRRQNEIMARIQAAIIQIPKPPLNRTLKAIEAQKLLKKKKEAEDVYMEIKTFEKFMRKESPTSSSTQVTDSNVQDTLQIQELDTTAPDTTAQTTTELLSTYSDDEYIRKIQKRLEEDSFAREQREKRRRKMLMEQLIAHEAQEEAYREEQLINRLMRQSQQERRIAVQLMHVRHEKEVLWQNRIFREKQYEERRLKEFQEALDREAALAKQEKIDYEEHICKERDLHEKIAAERAEARYKKHYSMCWEVIDQIIDLSAKTGEYRMLTNNLIPIKLMRDWKELFFNGKPIYEQASIEPLPTEPTPEQLVELDKMNLLDEKDYDEYKSMVGEWCPPEEHSGSKPPPNNNILGHVVHRLMDIVYPPMPEHPPPVFPPFPIQGCVLGKLFSGKSTCVKFLEEACNIQVLSVETLVQDSIKAFHESEMKSESSLIPREADGSGKQNEVLKRPPSASASQVSETVPKSMSLDGTKGNGLLGKESSHQEMKSSESKDEVSKLSVRACLGAASEKLLKKGKNIPDELLVDIMVEAIKRTPQKKGWVMDGFPMTINQAKLLEKALTGSDSDKAETKDEKSKKPSLVTDPAAPKDPPLSPPAFDFALLLDISDTTVLERVAGMKDKSGSSQIQLEDSDQASDLELKEREKIDLVRDQIQHRIAGFLDNWPKLEKWFSVQQNILVKVNGETEKNLLCKRIKEILLEEIAKKENRRKELEKKEAEKKQEVPTPLPQAETLTVLADKNKETESPSQDKEPMPAKSKSAKELPKKSESFKDKKVMKDEAPKGKDAANKPGSVRGKSPGKKSSSATPEDLPAPTPVGPPPVKPGSDEWVYVDEPLPKEIPEFLVPYWETVENTYENTIKTILRCLREERFSVIHYLADNRNHFKDYLKRPDHKQEFVSQWQSDYNSIADDLWEDEETKAELHQRVTDLRDRLWDICENRREEAEQERSDIMNDGWLPDHMGILMNHFFSLMQVEVDRFQDTKRFLHDYYRGMEGKMPTEACQEFARIPLLDIVNVEQSVDQSKSRRIPMVPRRPPSPEINVIKQKSKAIQLKSNKEENSSESIIFNFGADEKLITDTWQAAVTAISNMVTAEKQSKEAEEEKERQQLEKKEQERQKPSQAAGGKGGGKDAKDAKKPPPKSPTKKKGVPSPAPVVEATPIPLTPEELKKQELKLKMKQEYFSALEYEEEAAKSLLQLIKIKALTFVEELVMKAEETYKCMEKWLGARFLAEMSSVDKLTEIARHHIECSTRIQYELVLDETDFFISNDVKVIPDPIPPPRPPPVETSVNGTLTISQLSTLHKQFLQVAPKAIKALKHFKGKNIPPNKSKVGDEGKEKQCFEHQAKGNRQFLKTWLTKYPWLKYDDKRGIMFCALCRKHNVNLGENIHNFCSGTDIFKLEFINVHHSSEAHAWASCMEVASSATGDQASTEQMIKSMNKVTLGRIENIFRTCHAIAKCGRPFTDLDWMCKLDDMKGVDIGSMFRNDKSARTFIHYIAEVERRALKEKLEKCKFFSLISDGVADNAIKEGAVVYIRFASEGKVHCQIVGVQSVDKPDASTIKNAIVKILQINLQVNLSSQDWSRKLVGFGSDGADVMVGENNGVAKLLKEIQPCVQSVHCFAHRLELAYKGALKSIQLYTTLSGLLQNIYYFYHNSPLNKSNLKSTYETLKLRPAIPSRIGGTRWLSRLQTALQILLKGYPAILLHMNKFQVQEDPSASNHQKAKCLLKLLLKMEVVKFSHFLLDIINVLNILSRVTQDRNSSIADIFATMQSTLETLQMYKTRSGPKERLVDAVTHFHGHQLVGNENILPVRTKVLSNLVRRLHDCFCDASQDVLRATTIGSFKLWPDKIKQEFGEREVSILTKHYEPILEGANVKVDEVDTEWSMLKLELYDRFQNIRSLTWDSVNSDYSHKYPNILMLVDLILTLPASSAEAERGFSQMKLTMMQLHSKGMSESVTDLMIIQLNSPDIKKFDPEKAIHLWNSAWQRHRRLQTAYMITNGRSDCSSDSDFDSHYGSD